MAITQITSVSGFMIDGVMMLDGTVDLNGSTNGLILDADGDTTISSPISNQIDISIGGADDFSITANSLNVLTGSCIAGPSSTFVPLIPLATFQSLSGAGACNVTSFLTKVTTTGANALTLADGVVKGQLKKIQMVVDGGDGILTPSNATGFTTVTFANIGDYVILAWTGSAWICIESLNDASGIAGPTLA